MKFIILNIFIFIVNLYCLSQNINGNISLLFNIGSHNQSIGIKAVLNFQYFFVQNNISTSFRYFYSSYGNRINYIENRTGIGMVLLGGKREQDFNLIYSEIQHNTKYNYGIAYSYLWYFDNVGSSQNSGIWGLHLKKFSLIFENDVFGGQARDRFRTGMLCASYRYTPNLIFYGKISIWTGETRNSYWDKTSRIGAPNGYRSLEHLPFGRTSNGIFSLGVESILNSNIHFNNYLLFESGIDSELIRNFFQNKLSHDLILFPTKMKRNTPHYPILDENGCSVFKKSERRKDRFYIQFSTDDNYY